MISSRSYEQYCIYKQRNVRICEILYKDGKREFHCVEGKGCQTCKNTILPFRHALTNSNR